MLPMPGTVTIQTQGDKKLETLKKLPRPISVPRAGEPGILSWIG